MKASLLRFAVPALVALASQLHGQASAPAAPAALSQTLTYIKVTPGKHEQFLELMRETSMKVAQQRTNAGEIHTWTLLRSILPAGSEARAQYVISTIQPDPPPPPLAPEAFAAALKQVGSKMTYDQYVTQRDEISSLVAQELWWVRQRVGAPQKGHYVYLNHMRVKDAAAYDEAESTIWLPIAQELVKSGQASGWIYATKGLPAGADTEHTAYTADMFPTWEAAFKRWSLQPVFEKVHPGQNFEATMTKVVDSRSVGRRELWTVVERVEKSQ